MNKNRLVIALVVLAVLAVALVSRQRTRESATTVDKPTASLPKLKRDELTKIELEIPEKKLKATLVKAPSPDQPQEKDDKKDGQPEKAEDKKPTPWNLTEPLGAKADEAAIENMLDKLSELEVVGIAATRKENHTRLGVDKEHGVHVKAYGGDKLLADFYVGKSKSGGTMVRQEGEDVVVATKGAIDYVFDKELKYLRDRNVVELDPNTIKGVSLSSAKGNFKFEKPEGGKWQQVLGRGEKPIKDFAEGKVASLVSTFARLHAVDFNDPAETPEAAGLTAPQATLVLTPKEGGEVKFELGKLDAEKSEYVLRASNNPIVYRVSRYTGDRMIADATTFINKPEDQDKGRPIAGGGNLPPELLKQLQEQGGLNGGHFQAPPH